MPPHPLRAHELEQLGREGYFVRTDWLDGAVSRDARAALLALEGFRPASVGRGLDRQLHTDIRGDEQRWLAVADLPPGLLPVRVAFEALKDALNQRAFLCLETLELQAARYLSAGAQYERHRDSFTGAAGRRLTCIYYLNDGWIPAHGGCLRLHVAPVPLDVEPRLNSLVVFLSEEVEHEVLASYAARWALTAWWSGRSQDGSRAEGD